jgi:hypothetical protein
MRRNGHRRDWAGLPPALVVYFVVGLQPVLALAWER